MSRIFRSMLVVAVVVLLNMMLLQSIALASGSGCELFQEVLQPPNLIKFRFECPPQDEAGHSQFNYGDGLGDDLWFDIEGRSAEILHAYKYEAGGVITYTASLNYDGYGDDEYSFPVLIDDRSIRDFEIGELNYRGWAWEWPYTIRSTGVFTFFVDTNCNGLAGNHLGKFEWSVDGPSQGNIFGNYVESYFIDEPLVPTRFTISDISGTIVWEQEVLAPTCKVRKPEIVAEDGPHYYMDLVNVTVTAPMGAGSMLISTDMVIGEFPEYPVCKPLNDYVPVRAVTCEPGTRTVGIRVNRMYAESFLVFSRSWFPPYLVESNSEAIVRVDERKTEPLPSPDSMLFIAFLAVE